MSTETISGPLAQQILKQWKEDKGELLDKYGDLSEFAIQYELEMGWADPEIRAEFSDAKDTYEIWLRVRHLHTSCGGSVNSFRATDYDFK